MEITYKKRMEITYKKNLLNGVWNTVGPVWVKTDTLHE